MRLTLDEMIETTMRIEEWAFENGKQFNKGTVDYDKVREVISLARTQWYRQSQGMD